MMKLPKGFVNHSSNWTFAGLKWLQMGLVSLLVTSYNTSVGSKCWMGVRGFKGLSIWSEMVKSALWCSQSQSVMLRSGLLVGLRHSIPRRQPGYRHQTGIVLWFLESNHGKHGKSFINKIVDSSHQLHLFSIIVMLVQAFREPILVGFPFNTQQSIAYLDGPWRHSITG